MTAILEHMNADSAILRMIDGARMLMRAAQGLAGVLLSMAALVLWLAPGAGWESDVMLFKLMLSVVAVIAGLVLMQASARPRAPQLEVDTIRREVRLVRTGRSGRHAVLRRCAFDALSRVEHEGHMLRLWDGDDDLMAEVVLTDRSALQSLVAGLRDAGKLA